MSSVVSDMAEHPVEAPGQRRRGPTWVRFALGAVVLLLVAGAAAALAREMPRTVTLSLLLAVCFAVVALAYLGRFLSPTALLAGAVCLQVFSSNWYLLKVPLGLDRVLLVAALMALLRDVFAGRLSLRTRWSAVHVVLATLAVWATASAVVAGTLWSTRGAFALLDRLGLVPFLCFGLAPVLFRTREQRNVLLVAFVALGAYLGLTALFEGFGLKQLVFPRYILDPEVGAHAERARGPFLEGVANGLGLYFCAVLSFVAYRTWGHRAARLTAGLVCTLCLVGTVFTLTRAVWLATVVATLTAMLWDSRYRRRLPAVLAAGIGVVVLLYIALPGFAERATSRTREQQPIWDRYNTNVAALRIVKDRALTGIGWQRFTEDGPAWLRQAGDYPLTGVGIEVHNVFLSHLAELGLLGGSLFLLALTMAVGRVVFARCTPDTAVFRTSLVAIAAAWFVVASFGPLSYALPNTLLWLWAGLAFEAVRSPASADEPADDAPGPEGPAGVGGAPDRTGLPWDRPAGLPT